MKKLVLSVAVVLASLTAKAQWTYQKIDNGFDEPYKIAYTESNNDGYLKLEWVNEKVIFYLSGTYFCEDFPKVDVIFVVNGVNKKYTFDSRKSENSKNVFFTFDFLSEPSAEDFKNAQTVKVRVNETYCTVEQYTFAMGKSKSALEFISEP